MIRDLSFNIADIVAIEPCYGPEGGNMTRIYYKDGQVSLDQRRLETVLVNLLNLFGLELKKLRKNYSRYLNITLYVPLPITVELVFMPVKLRTPLAVKDGTTGYVNYLAMKGIVSAKGSEFEAAKCLIVLEGGHLMPCYTSRRNLEDRVKNCRIAHERFCSQQGFNRISFWDSDPFAFFKRAFRELVAEDVKPYEVSSREKLWSKNKQGIPEGF